MSKKKGQKTPEQLFSESIFDNIKALCAKCGISFIELFNELNMPNVAKSWVRKVPTQVVRYVQIMNLLSDKLEE